MAHSREINDDINPFVPAPERISPEENDNKIPLTILSKRASFRAIAAQGEKDDTFSESESESSTQKATIFSLFNDLHRHQQYTKNYDLQAWGLTSLINGFTTAFAYKLTQKEEESLFDDMQAVVTMLDAARAFTHNRANPALKKALDDSLERVCERGTTNLISKSDIAIWIGTAMAALAIGAAIGVGIALTLGATIASAPLIIGGLLAGSLALLIAATTGHIHQSTCTFFGQSLHNHKLMADLVIEKADLFEPKAAKTGCFG